MRRILAALFAKFSRKWDDVLWEQEEEQMRSEFVEARKIHHIIRRR